MDRLSDETNQLLPGRPEDEYRRPQPEQLLRVKQAAGDVGCCEETIRRAYLAGQLKVERIGTRSIRIRPSELRAWLARGGKTTGA